MLTAATPKLCEEISKMERGYTMKDRTKKQIQKIDWDLVEPVTSEPYHLRRTRRVGWIMGLLSLYLGLGGWLPGIY